MHLMNQISFVKFWDFIGAWNTFSDVKCINIFSKVTIHSYQSVDRLFWYAHFEITFAITECDENNVGDYLYVCYWFAISN